MKYCFLRLFLLLLLLCSKVVDVYGGRADLPKEVFIAANIPDSLKEHAHAVVRYSITEMNVTAPGKASLVCHKVVTILDEKGDKYAELVLGYDKKFHKVGSMAMRVYGADGKLVKKYAKSDAYDHAAVDGFSIVTDDRLLILQHSSGIYPITIETEFELDFDSYLDFPDWEIQAEESTIQQEIYKVTVASDLGFRYRNANTAIIPVKEKADGKDIYTWQVQGLKALEVEPGAPDWTVQPCIKFAANKFSYDDMEGDFSSWQSYGKWYNTLNGDVCTLPPARIAAIQQMVAGMKTDREKASYLYQYLQQNVRYVSIQLGVGGLKPFPASFVDQKKYGDCKALANYMCALLKAAGIKSYMALVRAGANEPAAAVDFPNDPFNHVILCIPAKGDTTWLECTSNTQPFGQLGSFTENRNALLITEDGGVLLNTPAGTASENQLNAIVHLKLDPGGDAEARVKIHSTGAYRDFFADLLPAVSEDKRKEYTIRRLKLRQPASFEYKDLADSANARSTDLGLYYNSFYDINSGDKKFFRPALLDLWTATTPECAKRTADFYFENPFRKSCTTIISLPEGYGLENIPSNEQYSFSHGSYQIVYKYDADKNELTTIAKLTVDSHIIPADKYAEMQQFVNSVVKAQGKKLVIKKKA